MKKPLRKLNTQKGALIGSLKGGKYASDFYLRTLYKRQKETMQTLQAFLFVGSEYRILHKAQTRFFNMGTLQILQKR